MTATRVPPAVAGGLIAVGLAVGLAVAVGACGPGPSPSPSLSPSPSPSLAPSPSPSPAVTATPTPAPAVVTPAPAPAGSVMVEIPLAGISLPVPAGWEQLDAEALVDEAVRADVAARYPGAERLLEAATLMGDRATPAFMALDPAASGGDAAIAPDIAVLVAQPAVGGPLLDFVAGFVSDGFRDSFGSGEPTRERVVTPIGEAVRLTLAIPADGGPPLLATAWVVGGTEGTLLISVIGPADEMPASDADAMIAAAAPLP